MSKNPRFNKFVAKATWDIGVSGTLTAGAASHSASSGSVYIPDGALITKAYYHVETTVGDDGDDSTTLALGYTGATGAFVAAIAISDASNVYDAGSHGTLVGMGAALGADAAHDTALEVIALNAATMIALTDRKELLLTKANDHAIDAGKLHLFVEYVQTGDLA